MTGPHPLHVQGPSIDMCRSRSHQSASTSILVEPDGNRTRNIIIATRPAHHTSKAIAAHYINFVHVISHASIELDRAGIEPTALLLPPGRSYTRNHTHCLLLHRYIHFHNIFTYHNRVGIPICLWASHQWHPAYEGPGGITSWYKTLCTLCCDEDVGTGQQL